MSKNKRFYWLKLPEDFFQSDVISWLEEQTNGIYYSNFYLKLCLMSINDKGVLIRRIGEMYIPYDVKRLSQLTGINIDTVVVAIELLKKAGLLEVLDNGALYLKQVENMVGSETASTQRSRRSREKKKIENKIENKLQCNAKTMQSNESVLQRNAKTMQSNESMLQCNEVLQRNAKVLQCQKNATTDIDIEKDKDTDKEKRIKKEKPPADQSAGLEELYECYTRNITRNGLCTAPMEINELNKFVAKYGVPAVMKAIEIAVKRNARSLDYIGGVLRREQNKSSGTASVKRRYSEEDIPF